MPLIGRPTASYTGKSGRTNEEIQLSGFVVKLLNGRGMPLNEKSRGFYNSA